MAQRVIRTIISIILIIGNRREHPTVAGERLFAYLLATGLMLVARR